MERITKRDLINGVAESWKKQFYNGRSWHRVYGQAGEAERIYKQLLALPKDVTEETVTAIIGNDTWTALVCDLCDEECDTVTRADLPMYDPPLQICARCALGLIEAQLR